MTLDNAGAVIPHVFSGNPGFLVGVSLRTPTFFIVRQNRFLRSRRIEFLGSAPRPLHLKADLLVYCLLSIFVILLR
jgi:hypothetical protein